MSQVWVKLNHTPSVWVKLKSSGQDNEDNEEDKKKTEQEDREDIKSIENMEKDADGDLLWKSKDIKFPELELTSYTSYTRKRPRAVPFTDEELEAESKKESKKKPLTKQEIKQEAKRKQSRQANSSHKDNKKRRVEWLENNTVGGSGEKKCRCGKPISLCDCANRKT